MGLEYKDLDGIEVVRGLGATGKTGRLVERVTSLAASGVPAKEICVVVASPSAASETEKRIAERLGGSTCPVVTTARKIAMDILATPGASKLTGRRARMLMPFEASIVMEDVKTCGVAPKRLRELLKFLYRSLTEMADDDPEWLYNEEEADVYETLHNSLEAIGAIMEPEASNLAVKYLRRIGERAAVAGGLTHVHVLADDFTLMSGASQVLCSLVARDSLWVAGNPLARYEVFDSYPYAAGLDALASLDAAHTTNLTRSYAPQPLFDAQTSLLANNGGVPDDFNCTVGEGNIPIMAIDGQTPEDDVKAEAWAIAKAIDGGARPDQIFVASQSPAWRRAMAQELRRSGIKADAAISPSRLSADPRVPELCLPAQALCALELISDPQSSRTWRMWCAFGEHLLSSRAFAELAGPLKEGPRDYRSLAESSTRQNNRNATDVMHVAKAYGRGLKLIEEARGLCGLTLLDFIEGFVRADLEDCPSPHHYTLQSLCAPIGSSDDAATMLKRAIERVTFPAFEGSGVRIGSFEQLAGLCPSVLLLSGFVNGHFPHASYFDPEKASIEKREKMRLADARLMSDVLCKPRQSVYIGWFDYADFGTAGRLKVSIDRIGLRSGKRVAYVSRSIMADKLLEDSATTRAMLPKATSVMETSATILSNLT